MPADLVPELTLIPAGDFLMGSEDAEEDERPVHRVQVDDFLLGLQPVTNAEYSRFTRDTGHRSPAIYELPIVVKAGGAERERTFRQVGSPYVWVDGHPSVDRADHPVTLVRYDDAAAYCAWLAATTGKPFRLPTEAEWEKAARGGLASALYAWGAAKPDVRFDRPPRVGTTPANALGLTETSGVCHEWCADWFDETYYARSPRVNPRGPESGDRRVSRGGAWRHADPWSAVAQRSSLPPHLRYSDYGVRLARDA